MDFKQASKISIVAIVVLGLAGLSRLLFSYGEFGAGNLIEATEDFGRINTSRFFLLVWETFWLSLIAVFFIYVAKRATTGKSEEQVEKLEGFEPLLFRIVIVGLILAALLTLLLPVFVGENSLPHYNQNDEGTVIPVRANQFGFAMNLTACLPSTDASDSCITLETDKRYIFELTSTDTTHGFTIYDSSNVLLIQAQIVPNYTTRLAFTFSDAGDYSVRCAEYCGSGHHNMVAAFTVIEGGN